MAQGRKYEDQFKTVKEIRTERYRIRLTKARLKKEIEKLEADNQILKKKEWILAKKEPKRRMVLRGYVYLIKSLASGHWKIGKSRNLENRVRLFNVKLPFEIELEHIIECGNMHLVEKDFHAHFADKRIKGSEWFALTPDDVAYIKSFEHF